MSVVFTNLSLCHLTLNQQKAAHSNAWTLPYRSRVQFEHSITESQYPQVELSGASMLNINLSKQLVLMKMKAR